MKLDRQFVSLFFTAGLLILSQPALALSKASTVTIESMQFNPAELTANVGDEVTWINKDLVPHTVTESHKSFDSKVIEPGKSWKLRIRKKGNFSYDCQLHPTMHAKLLVH